MAGHTILNLKEIEDMAPKFGFAPDLEARFATGAWGWRNQASATSGWRRTSGCRSATSTSSRRRST